MRRCAKAPTRSKIQINNRKADRPARITAGLSDNRSAQPM
ncbi:hypothetical protein A676_04984 [Salmonella enterica subsp. enterica serovar Enteritidis str. 2010K-0262]|uniref:Uncharacterized protein n=1 Tax=Salmonella enteritidis (strain 2009K0958) TaxID=1192586 RepID=A0A656IEI1_SALE2|nr:hypothetical protein A672_04618 [Salmonella enterica subsp. enterica serovar Enteritidis str. 08-1080]EPI64782.1 hypothetical protein A673_04230 [Salmonella enterica subsp. enterica serovar Enteritidis str. 2009K0958]EPI78234.1 hypothetical protein A676_04984 [Salmonella enterica subsp. enterica serovar Enteritidis str. 2010K-0262]EPI78526.1 hypothetical protein A674_04565 [Salmonella enterica subsp. enterica serovar Enteritidis str. 2009K1651]EPI79348.1 hypothetical protein A675_04570 [Salm